MKTTAKAIPLLLYATAFLCASSAIADFSGSDPLNSKSSKWDRAISEGSAKTIFQNSRLEYIVQRPTDMDTSAMRWVPNRGASGQDWFIQVEVHLDNVPLPINSFTNLNLGVIRSNNRDQGYFVSMDRYRTRGDGYVTGFEAGLNNELDHMQSNAVDGMLRIHYNSLLETLTASWNSNAGWHYFSPQYIGHWEMTSADDFTAMVIGSGGGLQSPSTGPVIRTGEAYFRNFKTGNAEADIAVRPPTGGDLVDGSGNLDMGHATLGSVTTKILTIRNDGTAPLRLASIRWAGADVADFSVQGRVKRTMRPGEKARLKVIFRAQTAGVKSATMKISGNDPDESPFDIRLKGIAAP